MTPGFRSEVLPDGRTWWRIAHRDWSDPLDPGFARRQGGRWNPPDSFPALYVNEDLATARRNLAGVTARWPYHPEDLREDAGPVLVGCTLPRRQRVADAHSPAGRTAAGLPASYPLDEAGEPVPHPVCQAVGARVRAAGLRGVLARSAAAGAEPGGDPGGELAWFPASPRSAARKTRTLPFPDWYFGAAARLGRPR